MYGRRDDASVVVVTASAHYAITSAAEFWTYLAGWRSGGEGLTYASIIRLVWRWKSTAACCWLAPVKPLSAPRLAARHRLDRRGRGPGLP